MQYTIVYKIVYSTQNYKLQFLGFPSCADSKVSTCNARDLGLTLGWKDHLEKEITTHSSILSWRIPWTEEPGGLQSMGSQRVGHN